MDAVETHGLEKRFGNYIAVRSFDMHVGTGDIYGFVGRNGAGKSTVLKMLCGLLTPTIGDIVLFGEPGSERNGIGRVGALIERPGLLPHLTAYQNLAAKALALGVIDVEVQCKTILEYMGLEHTGKRRADTFSLGMQQRLGIGLALVGTPDLLLLDEPLNGLDPEGARDIRNLLVRIVKSTGMTIIVSSHAIDRLSRMVTRYGVIKNGLLVAELTADELEQKCAGNLHVRTRTPERTVALLLENMPGIVIKAKPDDSILISNCDDDEVSHFLYRENQEIIELSHVHFDREEYFVNLMGGEEAHG